MSEENDNPAAQESGSWQIAEEETPSEGLNSFFGSDAEEVTDENPPPSDPPAEEPAAEEADAPKGDPPAEEPSSLSFNDLDEKTRGSFDSFLSEISNGSVKSHSELSEFFQKVQGFDQLRSENESLQSKIKEGIKPVYENELAKGLDDFMKKGGDPELYVKVQGVDIDKLSPEAKIKLRMKWDYPDLSQEMIDATFNKKYMANVEETDENKSDKSVLEAQMRMDAADAAKALKEHQKTYSIPDMEKQRQSEQEAEEQRLKTWDGFADDFSGKLEDNLKLKLDSEGKNVLNFPLTKEDKSFLSEKVKDIIQISGLSNDAKSKEIVVEAAMNALHQRKRSEIYSEIYNRGQQDKEVSMLEARRNPSGANKDTPDVEETHTGSLDDFILQANRR